MTLVALVFTGLLLAVGQDAPGRPPQEPDNPVAPIAGDASSVEVDLGTVLVTGQRPLEERATAFVDEVAAAPRGRGLARWHSAVCVGAANLNRRYAQFIIDRVSMIALDLGLEIGEPGCRPNIMIAAAADADALAARLVRDNPDGFRPALSQTDLGSRALDRFRTTDAPIRWWHVSLPVSADTGDLAIRMRGEGPPTIAAREASRLRSNVRDDLARVMIVIDATQIDGIPYGAISDYVALVALAQIDPTADTSAWPSVLNLFDQEGAPTGLTDWDRDYLHALYDAPRDRARPAQQAREIVRGMVGAALAEAPSDEEDAPTP